MRGFFQLFFKPKGASSHTPRLLAGLERRTLAALATGAAVGLATAGIIAGLGIVQAEDDSNSGYWLRERVRSVSSAVFRSPNVLSWNEPVKTAAPARKAHPANALTRVAAGGQSVCVRLCDGFFFPVGSYHGRSDAASHESVCQSQCPGAPTALYVRPNASSRIEDSVSAREGRKYSALAVALRYTQTNDRTCSCKPAGAVSLAMAPLQRDFTLRKGDSVMTVTGVKVFQGSKGRAPKAADFMALARSSDVDPRQRATLKALERVSAIMPAPQPRAAASPRVQPAKQAVEPTQRTVRLVDPFGPVLR